MGLPSMTARDRLAAVLAPEMIDALDDLVSERVASELARLAATRDTPPWLTLEQAGERLGCSADAVRMRVNRGRLESRRQGRRLYVAVESVDRLGTEA